MRVMMERKVLAWVEGKAPGFFEEEEFGVEIPRQPGLDPVRVSVNDDATRILALVGLCQFHLDDLQEALEEVRMRGPRVGDLRAYEMEFKDRLRYTQVLYDRDVQVTKKYFLDTFIKGKHRIRHRANPGNGPERYPP